MRAPPMEPPRLRLLTAPALLAPRALAFAPERRFRLAVVLALSPGGLTRDELAALFWPDRPQAAARSNLRKLILELRSLDLPGLEVKGERLAWDAASDARDLLEGRLVPGPAAWQEPLPGLGGSDSPAFDDWLLTMRVRLADARAAQRPAPAAPGSEVAEPALIGRERELAEAIALLGERRCRLLTVVGPGGVGKSALALELLRRPVAVEAEGVRWVALEDLDAVEAVPLRLARELGARVGPRGDGWSEAIAALHGRDELLVFDNAEHLPALAALLARLLEALPGVRLVVTSRVRLALPGECVLPVLPLHGAAARHLFIEAARRAPARQPLHEDDPALAALLALLGGLPLALRLAAAWTRHLPPATLRVQLEASLAVLDAGDTIDEHPAHRSLAACFERSWALLEAPHRAALGALCAGTGSMRLDVAQATAGADAAALAALADASLVVIDAAGRVDLHPLLRRFGRARLGAAAAEAALARHAAAIVELLRPWADFDAADTAAALAVMAPERQQIELAWATALAQRRPRALASMAGPTSGLVQSQGGVDAVLPLFAQAEALFEGLPGAPAAEHADLALEHAALHFWRGDHDPCERAARRALAVARGARLRRPMGQALNLLALVALRRGHTGRAASLMAQALAQARRAGHRRDIAIQAGNLAGIRRELGELDAARATAEEALAAHRALGFAIGESAMLAELSQIAHLQGRLDEAAAFNLQALQVTDRHGMALRRIGLLTFLGFVRFDQGRVDEAGALAAQARAELRASAARHFHETTLHRLDAELALRRGDDPAAREALRQACACTSPFAAEVNARGLLWSLAVLAEAAGEAALAAALGARAERGRPPRAVVMPRYARLRPRGPAAAEPLPDDDTLNERIGRLLG
jgi:tetratricopeptide (TPR) repeat protein